MRTLNALQQKFPEPHIRDLLWVALSPPLFLQPLGTTQTFAYFNPAIVPDKLESLCLWMQEHPSESPARTQYSRLGLYFEALLRLLFEQGHHLGVTPYKLVLHNYQLQQQGQTLGELDLLLRHNAGTLVHVEAAVKFYLAQHNASRWTNWIGPNAKDRLDKKLKRMLTHQLPLFLNPSHKAHIDRWLKEFDAKHFVPCHFIKGCFFVRKAGQMLPEFANPECEVGTWCTWTNWIAQHPTPQRWEKLAWLSGPENQETSLDTQAEEKPTSTQNTSLTLQHYERTPFMSSTQSTLSDSALGKRCMVVNDQWPA